jgi:hypothetical protein
VDRPVLYTTRFRLMGGGASVKFVDDRGREQAERLARAVEAEARRIEVKFSRYRENSVISEINRNAGRTPVAVDRETEQLVLFALDLARITGGRFDPTVGVLRRAWDFRSGKVPSAAEIRELLPLVDASAVAVQDRTASPSRRLVLILGVGRHAVTVPRKPSRRGHHCRRRGFRRGRSYAWDATDAHGPSAWSIPRRRAGAGSPFERWAAPESPPPEPTSVAS